MSISHSFSVDVAKVHGVDVALMLNHFSFWYLKNKSDNHQYYKGDYWVRMKAATMKQYYPYFTLRQLRYLVDKMIDLELIKQDEFNTKKNDRTKWYCLTPTSKKILSISSDKNVTNNKKAVQKYLANVSDKNVTNVTHKIVTLTDKNVTSIEEDTKDIYNSIKGKILLNISLLEIIAMQNKIKIITVKNKIDEFVLWCKSQNVLHEKDSELFSHFPAWIRKQNLKDTDLEIELNWFLDMFNKVSGRAFKNTEELKQRFAKQFAVGFSGDEMIKASKNLYSSSIVNKFHIQSAFKFATPEYLLKDDNLNKYLNFKI